MRLRVLAAVLIAALMTTPVAAADHAGASAKKCYAKKHGKRVRVKCKRKTVAKPPATVAPAPATPPAPVVDPQLTAAMTSALTSNMLHRFSTSASQAELLLHMCPGGSYQLIDFADQTGTAGGPGTWRVTGAERTPPGITAGLLLIPADGSGPRLLVLNLVDNADGSRTVTIGGDQWYLGPSTLCPPAA